jgi:uncharacterized protein Yka (UPF0111/DUF47 family)
MAAVFESREEETMKKITKKAMKALAASPPCQDLPDELKKYVIEACRRCVRQISIAEADPDEVQECLFEELANMYFEGASKKTLEQLKQCLGVVLKDLSKACSGYKDEAW